MIKFFRTIRKRLLSEGKTFKYLKYALGEIILVVIGILIALSINNWNQGNINRENELNYYLKIKRQLEEDRDEIEGNVLYNQSYLQQYRIAEAIIENNNRELSDSLAAISFELIRYSDLHRPGNIYETMVNSGEIKMLKNQDLIDGVQKLEVTYLYINTLESSHFDAIKIGVLPSIGETINIKNLKAEDPEAMYSYQFQNLFTLISGLMEEKNEVYAVALKQIDDIIRMVDEEVQKN